MKTLRYLFPRGKALTWLLLGLLSLAGCGDQQQLFTFTRFAMDTVIDYTIVAPERSTARSAMLAAQEEIQRIEHLFWQEDTTSEIYRLNQSASGVCVSKEVYGMFTRAFKYHHTTGGVFDLTIEPVLDLYEFRGTSPQPPTTESILTNLQFVEMSYLSLEGRSERDSTYCIRKQYPGVEVASGGLSKGYAVDRAIDILWQQGITQALVNAGGDLYCLGSKAGSPWKVGIQDPREENTLAAVLECRDIAVATSGDYRRYYVHEGIRYHHILDPETGKPARGARSSTVIAGSAERADALATALFILGPEKGIPMIDTLPSVYGAVIDSTGRMHYSRGMEVFLDSGQEQSD